MYLKICRTIALLCCASIASTAIHAAETKNNHNELDNQLLDAVSENEPDAQKIATILGSGANPNAHFPGNWFHNASALHMAARRRSIPVIKLLIARGAKVDEGDCYGQTPLSYVLQSTQVTDVIRVLVEANASITLRDKNGSSPLDQAQGNVKKYGAVVYDYLFEKSQLQPIARTKEYPYVVDPCQVEGSNR